MHRFRILPAVRDGEENMHMNPEAEEIRREAEANEVRLPWDEIVDETILVTPMVNRLGLENQYTYLSSSKQTNAGTILNDRWSPTDVVTNRLLGWRKLIQDIYKGARYPKNPLGYFAEQYPDIPRIFVRWFACMKYGPVSSPSNVGLVQAYTFTEHGKDVLDEHGQPAVGTNRIITLSSSCMVSMMSGLLTRLKSGPIDIKNNLLGDWCSLEGGQIATVYTSKADGSTKYDIRLNEFYPLAESAWVPWDELVDYPTVEEQIDMMVDALTGPVVDSCLRGSDVYADYIPEDIRGTGEDIPEYAEYRDTFAPKSGSRQAPAAARSAASAEPDERVDDEGDDDHLDGLPPETQESLPPPPPPRRAPAREAVKPPAPSSRPTPPPVQPSGRQAPPPPPPPSSDSATGRVDVPDNPGESAEEHEEALRRQTRERLERIRARGGNR